MLWWFVANMLPIVLRITMPNIEITMHVHALNADTTCLWSLVCVSAYHIHKANPYGLHDCDRAPGREGIRWRLESQIGLYYIRTTRNVVVGSECVLEDGHAMRSESKLK